jgi:hypothetical protein
LETEDSLFYLVFLTALAIQTGLVIVFLLFWLFRRSAGGTAAPAAGSGRYQPRSRLTVLLAAGSLTVSVVAAFTYLIFRSTSIDTEDVRSRLASEKAPVHSTPETAQSPQAFSPSQAKSADPGKGEGGFDSRTAETSKTFLRGTVSHSSKLKTTLSGPEPYTYLDLINRWLKEDLGADAGEAQPVDGLYQRLVKEYGFKGSKEVVERYLREPTERTSGQTEELPRFLDSGCGREAVVRWEPKTLLIAGQRTPVHLFLMRSRWSQAPFFRAFAAAGPEVFLDAHRQAFEFFGGGFAAIDYPELPGGLRDALQDKQGNVGKMFEEFSAYYHFRPKLDVGGDLERQLGSPEILAFPEKAATVEQLNQELAALGKMWARLTEGALRLFEDERLCLLTLPERPFNLPSPFAR